MILVSCAIQVAPEGGKKDVESPVLTSSEPANYSTEFKGHDIRLNFNEFVSLNDLNSQLVVSPLLKFSPEIHIRKKSILIHLKDTLLENTTYTMNFGQGIADNNEGNKLDDFQYVFSTGSIIDSLDIRGKVTQAFDGKTEKKILVMLYRDTIDSLPYLQRPVYFGRTNDSGQYRVNNISPGTYKIIGLKEVDGDYLYSGGDESIGFTDSLIRSDSREVNLRVFHEVPKLRFLRAYSGGAGKALLLFNGAADTVKWKWITDTAKLNIHSIEYSKEKDTVTIWYKNLNADSLSLSFNDTTLSDTITLRLMKKPDENSGRRKFAFYISAGSKQPIQHLYLPYYLQSNHPISIANFDNIKTLEDSLPIKSEFIFDDSTHLNFHMEYKWKPKSKYIIFIPPSTFTDIYGLKNDTTELSFISHNETDYGSVTVRLQKKDNKNYIVQLVDDAGEVIYRDFKANSDTTVELSNLDPRNYKLKIINDRNANGKWDTGNYLKHLQPEEVDYYPESITVRSNWDVDVLLALPVNR